MKLLHFADLHLDAPFQWAPPEVARGRRQALRDTLLRIRDLAVELGANALTCGGDLYEQDYFTPDTAAFLRDTFAELAPLPVLLAPGNHDWYGPKSLYRQVRWSTNVHVFAESALTAVELAEGFTVWGAAHRAPANTPGFLDGFQVDRGGVNIGLFHGSEQGALGFQEDGKQPHAPFRADQVQASGLRHALLGHFHRPRDAEYYTYPGNPDPLTFGEDGSRGAVLVEVSPDGVLSRQRHVVANSRVTDAVVDLTGAEHTGQIRQRVIDVIAPCSGVVRVTLVGEVSPDVDVRISDIASLTVPHLDALVPRLGKVRTAYDLGVLREEPTVRGQFVRDVLAAEELDEHQRRRVLTTGLRALDGRGDELEVH